MKMIVVAVGTESALKIRAVSAALKALGYDPKVLSYKAESGVGIQPVGTQEMEQGARFRAKAAFDAYPDAEYGIGIESGLVKQNGAWFDPACVVVLGRAGLSSMAFGAYFPVPAWMVEETLAQKTELGEVVKKRAGGGEKDPMKYLSDDTLPREQLLAQAIQCAFIPLTHSHRYVE